MKRSMMARYPPCERLEELLRMASVVSPRSHVVSKRGNRHRSRMATRTNQDFHNSEVREIVLAVLGSWIVSKQNSGQRDCSSPILPFQAAQKPPPHPHPLIRHDEAE